MLELTYWKHIFLKIFYAGFTRPQKFQWVWIFGFAVSDSVLRIVNFTAVSKWKYGIMTSLFIHPVMDNCIFHCFFLICQWNNPYILLSDEQTDCTHFPITSSQSFSVQLVTEMAVPLLQWVSRSVYYYNQGLEVVQEMKNKNELIVLQNVLENWEKSHSIVPEWKRYFWRLAIS